MSRAGNGAGNELSDFEKQRQANIAERDALLKKLTAEAQSDGLFTQPLPTRALGNNAKPPKKKTPAKKIKEEEAPAPRRVSSRLRGIAAESETAKRKADEEHEAVQQDERAKRVRKSDSFTYDDMVVWGQKLSGDSLIGVDVVTKGVAKPYGRTFGDEDVRETTDKDLKSLREEMSGLRLWDAWEPNRENARIPYRFVSVNLKVQESKLPPRESTAWHFIRPNRNLLSLPAIKWAISVFWMPRRRSKYPVLRTRTMRTQTTLTQTLRPSNRTLVL